MHNIAITKLDSFFSNFVIASTNVILLGYISSRNKLLWSLYETIHTSTSFRKSILWFSNEAVFSKFSFYRWSLHQPKQGETAVIMIIEEVLNNSIKGCQLCYYNVCWWQYYLSFLIDHLVWSLIAKRWHYDNNW